MFNILIISSVVIYFILLIILVLNLEDKSKIIKYSFLMFLISILIVFFLSNELVIDYLISVIIRFMYYPSFATIIAVLLITMILFIYNLFDDNIPDKKRIINYIFASFIFIGYFIFMLLKVNINSYNALYEGESLFCLRYITRSFTLWIITYFGFNYLKIIRGRSRKWQNFYIWKC